MRAQQLCFNILPFYDQFECIVLTAVFGLASMLFSDFVGCIYPPLPVADALWATTDDFLMARDNDGASGPAPAPAPLTDAEALFL